MSNHASRYALWGTLLRGGVARDDPRDAAREERVERLDDRGAREPRLPHDVRRAEGGVTRQTALHPLRRGATPARTPRGTPRHALGTQCARIVHVNPTAEHREREERRPVRPVFGAGDSEGLI